MALVDQIIGVESGGNPNATNPNSSASGAGQFINSTWVSMLRQHRPDLAQGASDSDLLALKSDPQLSREMTAAYAADNGAILSKAGLPVTPGSTYLAHFAGPQGAVKVLSSDPNAPVGDILGAGAVNANPFLRGMTVADLQAWADRKMGGSAPAPNHAPAAPTSPLQAIPQQPAPSFAQPQQAAPAAPQQPGSLYASMPVSQIEAPPPIFTPPRKPIDLSRLKAALASGNRGLFYGQG
jgi:hypothetical protein